MPSKLGKLIRSTRHAKNISLRELARRIGKSPAYIVSLELAEDQPGVSEDTLSAISSELGLDLDQLLALARKVPQKLGPLSPTQVALYRLIKDLSPSEQEDLKKDLEKKEVLSRKHKPSGQSQTSGGKS